MTTQLTIKKDHIELHQYLQSLINKKLTEKLVADIATRFLATKNNNGSGSRTTAYYDSNRNLVAVYCYYHKQWELVEHIAYGVKSGTKTGLNTMCKEGVSAWTKNNRATVKAKDELLGLFTAGSITSDEFKEKLTMLDTAAAPEPHSDEEHSFATLADLESYLATPQAE
jgi:hypothetical protein